MGVEFKKIRYKGLDVEVSKIGEIRYDGRSIPHTIVSRDRGRKGYKQISIKGMQLYVHRIVAEAYLVNNAPVSNKKVIFKSRDTLDCSVGNLEWGSSKTLAKKAAQTRSEIPNFKGNSKLEYAEKLIVAKELDNGVTLKELAKRYNTSDMAISRIRKKYCKVKSKRIVYSQDQKNTVIKLSQKHTAKVIALSTGIPYETCHKWIKKSLEDGSSQ